MMGQVLVFLLAGIIFALILAYGYRAVNDFLARADEVALIELKSDLKTSIRAVASSQDVQRKVFDLPQETTRICFINTNISDVSIISTTSICKEPGPGANPADFPDYRPIICDSWMDGIPQNVFLIPRVSIKIEVGRIDFEGGVHNRCFEARDSRVALRLEGRGDRTRISEWKDR